VTDTLDLDEFIRTARQQLAATDPLGQVVSNARAAARDRVTYQKLIAFGVIDEGQTIVGMSPNELGAVEHHLNVLGRFLDARRELARLVA
jgi:hypothetical protein